MTETTVEAGGIEVAVEATYVEHQSEPEAGRYVFAYKVVIRNSGDIAAQLLTRHWLITDADGEVQEVRGEGVVGEQPYLRPGESFEYTSWTVISTPVGSMHGSYQMVDAEGRHFDAPIAPFQLALPNILH